MRPIPTSLALLLAAATLPAAIWTGAGDGFTWNDPGNWSDGALPGPNDWVWDIGSGRSVTLIGPAPGGQIIKLGGGTLRWASIASASSVQVREGVFDFAGVRAWPEVELQGGTISGYILLSPMTASGGTMAMRIEAPLTLTGDVMSEYADAAYSLTLAGATLRGYLNAGCGVWLSDQSAQSTVAGHLHLAAGSALSFNLQEPSQVTPLIVTGELSSDYAMRIYFGLVDWTLPYWDEPHDFTFVKAWEGGIVSATFEPDPFAGNEEEGTWSQIEGAPGDVVMRWTPLSSSIASVAAVPEASAAPWAFALAFGAAIVGRRARPKKCTLG